MRTVAPALLSFLLLAGSAPPQELKTDALDKVKAATAFIQVSLPPSGLSGTGFLFHKRGGSAYILTAFSVVRGVTKAKVTFGSGTRQEKKYSARVTAVDSERNLACLVVEEAPDLPPLLDLGKRIEANETEAVYAVGFAFSGKVPSDEKRPEITIAPSSITAIRRNDAGAITGISLSGEIHPGLSGGPVINAAGRVLGITDAKAAGALSPDEIQKFLLGDVRGYEILKEKYEDGKSPFKIRAWVCDPLETAKAVTFAYVDRKLVANGPAGEKDKDGSWKKIHATMKSIALKEQNGRYEGLLEFPSDPDKTVLVDVYAQCSITRAGGDVEWTRPTSETFRLGKGWAPPGGTGKDVNPPPDNPPDPAPAPAPAGPLEALTLPDAVPIAAQLKTRSTYGSLTLAPDGTALYALDFSEGCVLKLNPDSLAVDGKVEISADAVAMTLAPDGKRIYVGSRKPGTGNPEDKPVGSIQAIATDTFTTVDLFPVKGRILGLVATDKGLVAATGWHAGPGLLMYDTAAKTEIYGGQAGGTPILRLSRTQDRVYLGDIGSSPANFHCVSLHREKGEFATHRSPYHGEHALGGYFEISPDGQFLVAGTGSVLRLAKNAEADLRFVSKIDPSIAIAMAPGSATFFTVGGDGQLKSWGLEKFDRQKVVPLGYRAHFLQLDVARRKLHGVFTAVSSDPWNPKSPITGRISSVSLGGP